MSTAIEPSPSTYEGHGEAAAHIPGAHVSAKFYVKIALILAVFTALETSTYWIDFAGFNTAILLILMVIKFVMVVLYFMHLKYSSKLTWIVVASGLFWMMILFGITMADYLTRGWMPSPTILH